MKKRLPVGVSDFEKLISEDCYYVDKSLLIKELLENRAEATLIPRPRRFGKTLNMSMLKCFFEKTEKSRAHLFDNLAISKHKDIMAHQGQYPVIFITFKSVEDKTWIGCLFLLKQLISKLYRSHSYLLEGTLLDLTQKKEFESIISLEANEYIYRLSLLNLSEYLNNYHKKKPIVLIDEYDVPMNFGFRHGYYEDVALFVRSFLNNGLKDNPFLEYGVITGALRIAKESIFTGFNNPITFTMLSNLYADKFGLLENEVIELLNYYNLKNNIDDVRSWYNGYTSGQFTIYNPWSIINFTAQNGKLQPYWINTGSTDVMKKLITSDKYDIREDIEKLLSRSSITKAVSETVVYSDIENDETTCWSHFLFTGYLTFKQTNHPNPKYVDLLIPNEEVADWFRTVVLSWFSEKVSISDFNQMLKSLLEGDSEKFKTLFSAFVLTSFSHFDVSEKQPEKFYHGFVLGMLASIREFYDIKSNPETALGRCDVMLVPYDRSKIGIVLEFKKVNEKETIDQTALMALNQIREKKYVDAIFSRGIKSVLSVGIAFEGKKTLIQTEISSRNCTTD